MSQNKEQNPHIQAITDLIEDYGSWLVFRAKSYTFECSYCHREDKNCRNIDHADDCKWNRGIKALKAVSAKLADDNTRIAELLAENIDLKSQILRGGNGGEK